MADSQEKPLKKKRLPMPTLVKAFLAILLAGVIFSMYMFTERLLPTIQQMQAMKGEAESFRAMRQEVAAERAQTDVTWEQLLNGEGRGQIIRIQGKIGRNFQLVEGGSGGNTFLYPPESPAAMDGPHALLYFSENTAPQAESIVEAVAYVSTFDPREAVLSISPEKAEELEDTVPRAILIAHPLRLVKAAETSEDGETLGKDDAKGALPIEEAPEPQSAEGNMKDNDVTK